jgi:cell division protein FtsQ
MEPIRPKYTPARVRIAERRKRANLPIDESGVLPGPRRALDSLAVSGRILSVPLLFLALAGFLYIGFSSRFQIRDVRVEGNDLLRSSSVVQLSGALDRSIWIVDTEQVAETLRTNAYVEEASAALTLPDRLTITVVERRPEVRWQNGGRLLLVDASGRVLGADATGPVTDTLIIEDRSTVALEPNDMVNRDALELGRELSLRLPNELGIRPARFVWNSDTGILVEFDGRTIVFGRSDHLDRKLAILTQLTHDKTAYTFLDLRPETPYYRIDAPASAPAQTP